MKIEIEEPVPATMTAGFLLLRVTTGVILAAHGLQKLQTFPSWQAQVHHLGIPLPEVSAPLAVAGELLGGLGLIVGLWTTLAAFGALCVMIVAIAFVHWRAGLFLHDGGFEYPLLLAMTSYLFMIIGAGPVSLDRLLRKRAQHRAIQSDERWQHPPYVPAHPSEAPQYGERRPQGSNTEPNPGYRG